MKFFLQLLLCFFWGISTLAQSATTDAPSYHVLCYHNVLDDPLNDPEKFTTSTAELVQHFSWLKENGYNIISVDDLIDAKSGARPLPPNAVLLTFDDGYRSFYTTVYPLLKEFNYPAVLALVGSWLQMKPGEEAPYDGHRYTRENFVDPEEIREMADSGLVEIASHSYDLHRGILANPQGNMLPAAVSRAYDVKNGTYESDATYESRIRADLTSNSEFIKGLIGKRPRVMVWPYGRYNADAINTALSLRMPITLTLEDGANSIEDPLYQIRRTLVSFNMTLTELDEQLHGTVKVSPERVMHVDLDYVYDVNPVQQEENLGKLLDRVKAMKISTVYLQAYADPDGNGAANSLYFPNRHLPMKADLFSRVAWQLKTRAGVKVFAWMPLLAFELPEGNLLASHMVLQGRAGAQDRYPRLTPFDGEARTLISELYEDLAKGAIFDGILFHDDATLNDYEDESVWAHEYYSKVWGLPASVSDIRHNPAQFKKWTQNKTQFLTQFSLDMAQVVRRFQPRLLTARNIYAEVVLNPESEEWYAQSLPDFLQHYDYTAIMAMPYMENALQPMPWLKNLVSKISIQPNALAKTVFELQSVDWRYSRPVDSQDLAGQMKLLQSLGANNFGYYPDNFLQDVPKFEIIKPVFSLQDFPYSGKK